MKKILLIIPFILAFMQMGYGQNEETYSISGQITDASSGEDLISATVYIVGTDKGTISNLYGFYSITLPKGNYEVVYSYLGFKDVKVAIELTDNINNNIELFEDANVLTDIVVVAKEENKNVKDVTMGRVDVSIESVKKMPALFGEVDIIKAIQILPGIKSIGEATSGFYVRGGNTDQNLVLLDEAPIYNASHMLGFFSAFNPDAIKDMKIYKGTIPAIYGGRLSSVLDIRMKEGNSKKLGVSLGLGTMMSRLTVEAPIAKKGSFMLSGRRSYLDVGAALYNKVKGIESDGQKFYFYDLNAKTNYKINENNRLFASGYLGRDVVDIKSFGKMNWGNSTGTLRWNHIVNPKLFTNVTAYYSNYDYFLDQDEDIIRFIWGARLQEWSGKIDATYFLNSKNTISVGMQSIFHKIEPGKIETYENDLSSGSFTINENKSIENAFYASNEHELSSDLTVTYGLRLSSLANVGPKTSYTLDENFEVVDSVKYTKGIFNTQYNLEPRLGLRYSINNSSSIKASYNRTVQYIQQASNGNTATPLDIWFTSNEQIKPQLADQYSIGYFKNLKQNTYETSVELYYKKFINVIDFKERAVLLLNENIDGELRFGKGKAYGAEFSIKKQKGRLTGQIGYTYSKVQKKIDTINKNDWYNAKYDQPHSLSIIASYQLSRRWSISSNFVINSGNAVTFPTGKYELGGTVVPVYSDRNGSRLPTYHRMDISATRQSKRKLFKKFETEWVFGIYNVYNRKNAYSVDFKQDEVNPQITYAERSAVFSIVPSFTFNAKF